MMRMKKYVFKAYYTGGESDRTAEVIIYQNVSYGAGMRDVYKAAIDNAYLNVREDETLVVLERISE